MPGFKFFLLLFLCKFVICQNSVDSNYFKYCINYLSSDEIKGRGPKSPGLNMSADFIVGEYKKNGLKPAFKKKSFSQWFFLPDSLKEYKGKCFRNIVGVINNKADSTVVIGAHYDHIDTCSSLSKEIFKSKKCLVHNGADDNASGVAMTLALANYLRAKRDPRYNYVVVMYSAHETGLYGSRFFYESHYFKKLNVKAVLNFDMVGRLNMSTKQLKVGGIEKDENIKKFLLAQELKNKELLFLLNDEQLMMSDATVFYKNNISTFTFTTGIHEDYHKSTDDAAKINYKGMKSIFDFMIAYLAFLEK